MALPKDSLNTAYNVTASFVESIPKKERKKYGQFFTSRKTAEFMASLFTINFLKPELRLLDAGAGTGLLTAALVERLRDCGYEGDIVAVCYENDVKVLPTLAENLENLKKTCGIKYEIRIDNYLTSQNFIRADFYKKEAEQFDMIIGNPPYLKIAKDAPEALAMSEVCYGAPNLYFLFWAMGINNLKSGEEMVYIIPRSWTSGAYFERFRKYLFSHCVITNIHIFGSRDKVFDGESVLQETMIIKVKKTRTKPQFIEMSSSETSDFADIKYYQVDYNTIVAPNQFVFLVTSQEEAEILSRVNSLTNTLESDDLRMRTGIIVDFRTREVLRDTGEDGSYPLFYSQHIRNGRVSWPVGREAEYIVTDRIGYLQENTDYLFVKRFTSKEEKRRLQCGIYLKADHSQYKYISTQNKINYIKCDTPEVAYGLYVLLNSTLYDSYYRILNGSTQVNSTEINLMPVPSKEAIRQMGLELIGQELTEQNCDKIVNKWIR
ncbi:MAG: Eco57I restriction-modification methylase domain-containing protein [Bacteroidaceae bacterium]|nr:Eco57I restriction-modification methylase domain-containing protein [Bacteroidaceae bacterium]